MRSLAKYVRYRLRRRSTGITPSAIQRSGVARQPGRLVRVPLTFFGCECYLTIVPLTYSKHSLNIYSKNVVSKARDVMR